MSECQNVREAPFQGAKVLGRSSAKENNARES